MSTRLEEGRNALIPGVVNRATAKVGLCPPVRAVLAAAAVVVCLAAASSASARPLGHARDAAVVSLPSLSAQVVAAVNRVRVDHGLRPLTPTAGLTAAALRHSVEMARDGYFAHSSRDGAAFWKRIQAFYPSTASSVWEVGENLVYAAPTLTAGEAIKLWLRSPEHRRNLLDPRWQQMGVAAVHVHRAGGVYGGQSVTLITNDFGARTG